MTVDFEDYRRQELRDHFGGPQLPHPNEVERQVDLLLDLFEGLDSRATFFSVGRLTGDLRGSIWGRISERHSGRISSEQGASEHALTHGRRH